MHRRSSKNGRSARAKKLESQIADLEARLRKARAQFDATDEFDVRDAQQMLDLLIDRVESDGERLYLRRGKKRVAALVPADEGEYLDELEDRYWSKAAEKAMKEPGAKPWQQVKKELGL